MSPYPTCQPNPTYIKTYYVFHPSIILHQYNYVKFQGSIFLAVKLSYEDTCVAICYDIHS